MQVDELFELTQWIATEVEQAGIRTRYEELHAQLLSNAQSSQQQPFENQKNNLLDAIRKVPLHSITLEQRRFLDCIGIGDFVGERAVAHVEDVLFRNVIDPATAAAKIKEAGDSVAEGLRRSTRLREDLEDCVIVEEAIEDGVLVRVIFDGDASINNVVDLKEWTEIWHRIVRGIAMAHKRPPEDVKVVGAGRGSLLLDLAASYDVALTVTGIVLAALGVTERVFRIRKQAVEIEGLQLSNKKIAKELEAEAEKVRDTGAEGISAEFTAKLKIDPKTSGDIATALGTAVKDLVGFLEKGGEVDCVIPEPTEGAEAPPDEKQEELRKSFREIRQLEAIIRQLGPGNAGTEEGEQR
jgi:hypothetical protein